LDDYQCKLILDTLKSLSGSDSPTLFGLPSSTIQLLFSGPSLLANAEISTALDNAITIHYSSAQPNITSYGLNPLMVRLLSSASAKRRSWAISQIPACARRPVSLEHWCDSGLGEQVQALYTGTGDASQEERFKGMEVILRCGALSADAVEKGLIEGRLQPEGEDGGQQGFMVMLSHLLGSPSECRSKLNEGLCSQIDYTTILNCFALLLSTCPSPVMWTFDTSPDLPHTLFSEIKDNASFQKVITEHYQSFSPPSPQEGTITKSKGKGKEIDSDNPMSWISDFLRSLVPLKGERRKSGKEMALPQALAKAMNFCFAEMQHERVSVEVMAASAQCGFDVSHVVTASY
jgi:senataxin